MRPQVGEVKDTFLLRSWYPINNVIEAKKMELVQIKERIHEVRGMKVMLDVDLARIYEVETRVLKQAVRRNIDRFPSDFMFEINQEEWGVLRSQFVTLEIGRGKHSKYLPFAFTEQGVAMLSAVLNSRKALEMSIQIMRAFVHMRQWALSHEELAIQLRNMEKRYDRKFVDIEQVLTYLMQKDQKKVSQSNRSKIGFKE